MNDDNDLLFTNEKELDIEIEKNLDRWKILIVDDEKDIHEITKLALNNFVYDNKGLKFLHAYSMKEAKVIMDTQKDIAVILLDVVMETSHAGLDLVHYIREKIGNNNIRIILRTGQPGQAPERVIITEYDINDYIQKADVSAQKLFTMLVASIRAYKDILNLENSRNEVLLINQKLYEERKRIQVTLDSIGDAVITTDAKGKVTHLNPVAEYLTGWSIEDAKGEDLLSVFKIINLYSREKVDNPVDKVLKSGAIVDLANHTLLINKRGIEYHIADSAAPIRDEYGKIVGVILVCRDVTDKFKTEDILRRSQKMEAIGQLSGGIAHDFNNQLSVIIGYLDFLEGEFTKSDKQYKWVETATKATLRCMDLTKQLLSFSRKKVINFKVVNINLELLEMKNIISRSITPEIEIIYLLEDKLWDVDANDSEFQDSILNLVINARDAMPSGGQLTIETKNKSLEQDYVGLENNKSSNKFVEISISDTGIGIEQKEQDRIFDPFFTTKEEGKGTGLGLSMVHGFTKRYNGFIKVYSEKNIGTVMRLYLPRSNSNMPESIDEEMNNLEFGNEMILVVDDEVDLMLLAQEYLQNLGYKTRTASNGVKALEMLNKYDDIDMLFTDVVMPGGINGYELAEKVHASHPNIKILLTSGFTSRTLTKKPINKFSKTLLSKPYRKKELGQKIREILDK